MKFRSRLALELGLPDDERALDVLQARLKDAKTDRERKYAALALKTLQDKHPEDELGDALDDPDLLLYAGYPLAGLGKRGLRRVRMALKHPDEKVRVFAVELLDYYHSHFWQLRDKRAVEPLLTLLSDDSVQGEAISALGWLHDERAVQPLIELLGDAEPATRDMAATSLGLIGDSRAVAPLIKMLQTEEIDKRADAARALGRIGDPAALPALQWVKEHDADICCSTYEARDAASDAIRNIKRRKKNRGLATIAGNLNLFSEDFMPQREQPEEQRREPIFN